MNNIMIDIESLNNTQDSVIASVAAVKFDLEGIKDDYIYDICYKNQPNRTLGIETVRWWMQQDDHAREIFKKEVKPVQLNETLIKLRDFIKKEDNVWANGTLFDIGILENAFKEHKIWFPWSYGKIRCLRAIRAIYPEYEELMEKVRTKISHNALDDAKDQANALIALAKLKGFSL